jgi:hypothetical protein
LRSRVAFSLATRLAFSNCAMAPSTWRTKPLWVGYSQKGRPVGEPDALYG